MSEQSLLELYRSESRDHLVRLSRAVLGIERGAGREAVDEAFRSAHTLKGMAGAMGHTAVVHLAHGLEHLLETLRSGVISADAEVVDMILKAVDELERVVEEACEEPAAGVTPGRLGGHGARLDGSGPPGLSDPGGYVRIAQERIEKLLERTGELLIARDRLVRYAREAGDEPMQGLADGFARSVADLRQDALRLRLAPIGDLADRVQRVVRDAARALGKAVRFEIEGGGAEIDRVLLGEVQDLLTHLLRNAVAHGIESAEARQAAGKPAEGSIWLIASEDRDSVVLRVEDDGGGIDAQAVFDRAATAGLVNPSRGQPADTTELLDLLVRPGFSTAEQVTELSGRGVGLDHVASRLMQLGGDLRLETRLGAGTTFILNLPRTLSQTTVVVVGVGDETVAIPLRSLQRIEDEDFLAPAIPSGVSGEEYDDRDVVIVDLGEVLGLEDRHGLRDTGFLLVLGDDERRVKLRVDALIGLRDVVVRRFAVPRAVRDVFAGATTLTEGMPCLVLEPKRLLAAAQPTLTGAGRE